MNNTYTNNKEIVNFITKAQNKIADLSTLLVERGMDEATSLAQLLELSDFIENLDSTYCYWKEEDILRWIHEHNYRANLNSIPYINFTGYSTSIIGNGEGISLPITTDYISDYISTTTKLIANFSHNNLSNLQGGSSDERYHITKPMYDYIVSMINPVVNSTVNIALNPSIQSWPSGYFELGTSIPSVELIGSIVYNTFKQAAYFEYKKNNQLIGTRNSIPKKNEQPNKIVDNNSINSDTLYSFSALFDNGLQQASQYIRFKTPMYYGIIKKNTSLTNIGSKLVTGTKDVRDKGEMNLTFTLPSGNTLVTDNSYYCPYLFIPLEWGKFSSAINSTFDFAADWTSQQVTMPLLDGTTTNGLYILYPTQIEGVATFKFNW